MIHSFKTKTSLVIFKCSDDDGSALRRSYSTVCYEYLTCIAHFKTRNAVKFK
jgi:hypothetical protein